MMYFRNIACCSIIRTYHFSEPPLVLISSDNRRSTVHQKFRTYLSLFDLFNDTLNVVRALTG